MRKKRLRRKRRAPVRENKTGQQARATHVSTKRPRMAELHRHVGNQAVRRYLQEDAPEVQRYAFGQPSEQQTAAVDKMHADNQQLIAKLARLDIKVESYRIDHDTMGYKFLTPPHENMPKGPDGGPLWQTGIEYSDLEFPRLAKKILSADEVSPAQILEKLREIVSMIQEYEKWATDNYMIPEEEDLRAGDFSPRPYHKGDPLPDDITALIEVAKLTKGMKPIAAGMGYLTIGLGYAAVAGGAMAGAAALVLPTAIGATWNLGFKLSADLFDAFEVTVNSGGLGEFQQAYLNSYVLLNRKVLNRYLDDVYGKFVPLVIRDLILKVLSKKLLPKESAWGKW